jgi:glycosyltransferase involved in cell wall biosynthesis
MQTTPGFSIIIPTFNREKLLHTALRSVQMLHLPDGFAIEILVIDNNSIDATPAVAAMYGDMGPYRVSHIVETNQGLNHARNRGVAEASYEYLVFLDDDMEVSSCWLYGYIEAIAIANPHAVVGPVDPVFETEVPSWLQGEVHSSVTSAYSRKGDNLILLPRSSAHELPGCNFGVLKSVVKELGGFHPRLDRSGSAMLAGGDWEFGERLVRYGYRTAYAPKCRIRHLVSAYKTSKAGLRARWHGLGATAAVMDKLRGDKLGFAKRFRLIIRTMRFAARSLRSALTGDQDSCLRWELLCRRNYGYLFYNTRSIYR